MNDIAPGDWVKCVRTSGERVKGGAVRGRVYKVLSIIDYGYIGVALAAEGIIRSGLPCGGWDADCFVPIYRPKASFLRDLMQPVDLGVDA